MKNKIEKLIEKGIEAQGQFKEPESADRTLPQGSGFNKAMREMAPYMNLGIQMALTIVVCAAIGWWLDKVFDTKPVLILFFSLFGIAVGMYNFFRVVSKIGKQKKESVKKQ